MTGKTHRRIGAGVAVVAAAALMPASPWVWLLVIPAWLTSRLPDRAEHWIPWLMPWRWRFGLRAHILPWRWVTVSARRLAHRRVTHYPELVIPLALAVTIIAFLMGTILGILVAGAALGVILHLAADAATITGLPSLRHPDRRYWLTPHQYRVRTDGTVEPWLRRAFTFLALAAAAALIHLHRQDAPAVDLWIIVAAGVVLILLTAPARYLLRTRVLRAEWTAAVIHSGVADPPKDSSRKKRTLTGPRLTRVEQCAAGYRGTVKIARGSSYEHLEAHRAAIGATLSRSRFKVRELRLHPDPADMGRARATIVLRDPLATREPVPWPWRDREQTSLWDPVPFGVDEDGAPVTLDLVYRNVLIGGQPDAGKSVALQNLVAAAALDPAAHLWGMDGKDLELAAWAGSMKLLVGPNGKDAVRLLQHIETLINERQLELKGAARKLLPEHELPFHVVVIDEVATYMELRDRRAVDEITRLLRVIISKGRALGFILLLATQKPHGDILDTNIRDLIAYRFALSHMTPAASNTTLGDGMAGQGFNAASIPVTQPGVGFLRSTGMPVKLRGYYSTDEDLERLATRAAGHRVDQVLGQLPAPSPTPPTPKAAEQREQRDRAMLLGGLPRGEGARRPEVLALGGWKPSEWKRVSRVLDGLVRDGLVAKDGRDGRRFPDDPYRWRLCNDRHGRLHNETDSADSAL